MTTHRNLGLGTILGILFIILKLTGVITWPWLWILCPFWIGLALTVLLIGVPLVCLGIGWCLLWAAAKLSNE